jgi:hypothetical protein
VAEFWPLARNTKPMLAVALLLRSKLFASIIFRGVKVQLLMVVTIVPGFTSE